MRHRIAYGLVLALVGGCGDDSGTVAADAAGGGDARADGAPPVDGTLAVDGAAADAAPGDGANGVVCGEETCDPGEDCCIESFQPNGCMTAGACPGPARTCDGPEDCADGEACCLDFGAGGNTTSCREPG